MHPTRPITRLLVANRGEIARRIFRTCRDLGIETVAVHSDADADLPFVREADVAVRLPGSSPTETYLRGDLLVAAAERAGADAVHPGYGFLSENADFARRVLAADLTWVGPRPEAIETMGSKVEAKRLMEKTGVPVLSELDPSAVAETSLPILVKASAGGGGRGMRVVRRLEALADEVRRAADEAASAFGDATVFCEPYVEHGRHVEVQVLGDAYGNVRVLGERDCSLQRRHQKVLEEAPAPGLPEETRTELHEAARRAAEAIDYVGAGTVEFLVAAPDAVGPGRIPGGTTPGLWFLEMNTRLQVEHPITECLTGVDLVAAQIAIAEGRRLHEVVPAGPPSEAPAPRGHAIEAPAPRGHAIEARLYAEDPANGWQPQGGRLARFEIRGVTAEFENPASYGIRLDSGFETGSVVGTHYDAMLAKVVAWAPTRDEAARRLAACLRRSRIHGVRTNRELLVEVLTDAAFMAGEVSTDFLENRTLQALKGPPVPGDVTQQGLRLFAAAVAVTEQRAAHRPVQRGVANGWRNVVSAPQVTTFAVDGSEVRVGWHGGRDGYRLVDVYGQVQGARASAVEEIAGGRRVVVEHEGVAHPVEVFLDGDRVDVESVHGHLALSVVPRFRHPADRLTAGSLIAPMPGSVVSVAVALGDEVSAGQPVLVLEAMKMQHTVAAPHAGRVTEIPVAVGDQVAAGAVLAVVPAEAPPAGARLGADAAAEGESA